MSKISIEKIITYCNKEFKTKRGTQNHQEKCQYCSDSDSDCGSDSDSDPEPDDSVIKSWYVTLGKCSDAHSVSL